MQSTKGHVLLVAYFYPPSSEAGAKRAIGFHRFLPEWNYRSTLVTIGPETDDVDMERNVVRVHRSGYRQGLTKLAPGTPSKVLRSLVGLYKEVADVPDGYGSFFAPAVAAGLEVHRHNPVDAVIATSSPYTSLRIGSTLSRKLGVPWIADLRDLWTDNHFGYHHSWLRRLVDSMLEKRWLRTAGRITTTTHGFSRQLRDKGFSSRTIYNGFLEQRAYQPTASGAFRIAFLGRLYEGVEHTPEAVFQALRLLRRNPAILESIRADFFGAVNKEFWDLRERLELAEIVHYAGQVSASTAREEAHNADLLLVFLPDNLSQAGVVPTKLFDYAATRRPVLFVGPDGEAAGIVRSAHLGRSFRASDAGAIADWIEELAEAKQGGRAAAWGDAEEVSRFHYRWRAEGLAAELDAMLGDSVKART